MKAVVMFSGGKGSYIAASRAVARYGAGNVVLLFADTLVEDEDVYHFIEAAAAHIGSALVRIADGRTPFEVFRDRRFLGNSRQANCSQDLKVKPCRSWVTDNAPADAVIVVGIDWMEEHRIGAIITGYAPRKVWAPLCDKPYLLERDMLEVVRQAGLPLPKSYAEGFTHANCLQQGCVRGGLSYWKHYLRVRPELYAKTEQAEEELRTHLGKPVTMLKRTRNNVTEYLTLKELRLEIAMQPNLIDVDYDWGGCGCFIDSDVK